MFSAGRLAAHEAGDGGGCLFDLGLCDGRVAGAFGFDGGAGHAMADMLFEQVQGDSVERLGDRGNLGEDVDAVLIFVDHAGDAANLPFDAAQALEVRLFGGSVSGASPPQHAPVCASVGSSVGAPDAVLTWSDVLWQHWLLVVSMA